MILLIILSTNTAVLPLPAAAATSILDPFSFIAYDCSFVHLTSAILSSPINYFLDYIIPYQE